MFRIGKTILNSLLKLGVACSIFVASHLFAFDANDDLLLKNENNSIEIEYAGTRFTTFQTTRLIYRDRDGYLSGSTDSYLLGIVDGVQPIILDGVDGHGSSLKSIQMKATPRPLLAWFFVSGTHIFNLRLYRIHEFELEWIEDAHVTSNIHSINIVDQHIVVKNTERLDDPEDNRYKLITESYALEDDKLVLKERKVSLEEREAP